MLRFLKNSVLLFLIIACATLVSKFNAWRNQGLDGLVTHICNQSIPAWQKQEDLGRDGLPTHASIDIEIEFAGSILKGSITYLDNEIKGTLAANNLSATLFPQEWCSGEFSLNAQVSGSPTNPNMQLILDTTSLKLRDQSLAKYELHADQLSILIKNKQLFSQGTLKTSDWANVDYTIGFPIEFSLNPWSFHIPPNAPLSGSLYAKGEMAPFLHTLLDTPTSLSGKTEIQLNLSGTYQDPLFNGTAQITHGSYEIPEISVLLTDLTASINVDGPKLSITELSALDGKGGRVFGSGFYYIDETQKYPYALNLTLQEASLLNQDYIKIICNGPLTFRGNTQEGALIGKLEASSALITIPERSSSTINTVDVTYVNIPENTPRPQSLVTQKSSWPLSLDINLQFPKALRIEGHDLSSIWGGEVDVQGTGKSPLLYGELKIVEGQYLFNGNPFALNQATVTFAGEFEKKTTLYAIASRDLDKVKVDVIAKGPVKNPAISFRSNPPMPQREILSWLLFNRGTSEISPFQGAQLSESITNLSTNQQGPDVLSKIRSTLKIDRFEIGRNQTNEGAGVNVEVGKYISDNILISVIKSDVNRIALEATLSDQIKLQAQVGDDSEGKLMLRWKKDY